MLHFFGITVQITIIVFVAACIIGTSLLIIGSCIRLVSYSLTEVVQIREVMKRDKVTVFKAIATMRDHKTKLEMAEQKIVQLEQGLQVEQRRRESFYGDWSARFNSQIKEVRESADWCYDYEKLYQQVSYMKKEFELITQLLSETRASAVKVDLAPLEKSLMGTLAYLESRKTNGIDELMKLVQEREAILRSMKTE